MTSRAERVKTLTDRLEQGVQDVFSSEQYQAWLNTLAKFHQYSFNNVLLIRLQCPGASRVAGFQAWKKLGRSVKKGEKGISILAPCPYKRWVEQPQSDPVTHRPLLDDNGEPQTKKELLVVQGFKIATVFDVSQTEGKELPRLGVEELAGTVEEYAQLRKALEEVAPVPVEYAAPFSPQAKGQFDRSQQKITVRPGMGQLQTLKTLLHETAHALLHNEEEIGLVKDRSTREVEAESVAYVVCQHFGLDTGEYSFGYVAGWSQGRETQELKNALSTIRDTAAGLIDQIEKKCPELFPLEVERAKQPMNKER